jgi:hypothetical protein
LMTGSTLRFPCNQQGVRFLHFAGSMGWRAWEALTEKKRQKTTPGIRICLFCAKEK